MNIAFADTCNYYKMNELVGLFLSVDTLWTLIAGNYINFLSFSPETK